jgi:hypothetical protein
VVCRIAYRAVRRKYPAWESNPQALRFRLSRSARWRSRAPPTVPGVRIERTPPGSEPGIATSSDYPGRVLFPARSGPGMPAAAGRGRAARGGGVRTVGFEPTLSGTPCRRIPRLSYVLKVGGRTSRRSIGKLQELNLYLQRSRLSLYQLSKVCKLLAWGTAARAPSGSRTRTSASARQQATVNITGACRSRSGCQRTDRPVSPEGLEPSPTTLREWNAAANTLDSLPRLPRGWARRDSNP